MSDGWYDTAQICINGHIINSMARSHPEHKKKFCDKCGAPTITNCPKCNTPIKGRYYAPSKEALPVSNVTGRATGRTRKITRLEEHSMGTLNHTDLPLPVYCPDCGKPYPWTEAKLKAAQELSDELDDLSLEERQTLKNSLDDIIRDTPQTTVASTRFKRLVAKAGKTAVGGFRDILVDIASETAKKLIWPSN